MAEGVMHGSEKAMAEEEGRGEFTEDGTVDLKGNPVLRSKTGGWTACSFIVVYEIFERMAYYGISSNLVIYLTTKLHQGTVASVNNVTNWSGSIWLTPVLGAYVADALLGRYWTFIIASVIYVSGMCLLTLAVSLPALRPPPCHEVDVQLCKKASPLQLGVFFLALYVLAIGTGGTKPNVSTIGADQFDSFHPKEKTQKMSFFNWWVFSIFLGTLIATTFLVYIQDNVGWTLGYGLPTLGLVISVIIFLAGTRFYRHKLPTGSPFTRMARVIVAAFRKWRVPIPSDPKQLFELDLQEYELSKGKYMIDSTNTLRFLNKASVKTSSNSPWMLCPVTQVEETKQMLCMIPIFMATFVPGATNTLVSTLFLKQGVTLDKKIGSFSIPPASLGAFFTISILVSVVIYDRFFVRMMRRWTKNPRGITPLQRMGIGLLLLLKVMVIASLVERRRLSVAKQHGLVENGGTVPLSIFILLPQFILIGTADAFLEVGKLDYFYHQAPESMKSLGTSFAMTSLGIGNFLSTFLVSTVSRITKSKDGQKGWILNNLNASHLDYYYAFLVVLNALNFLFYAVVTKFHDYKADTSKQIDGNA